MEKKSLHDVWWWFWKIHCFPSPISLNPLFLLSWSNQAHARLQHTNNFLVKIVFIAMIHGENIALCNTTTQAVDFTNIENWMIKIFCYRINVRFSSYVFFFFIKMGISIFFLCQRWKILFQIYIFDSKFFKHGMYNLEKQTV